MNARFKPGSVARRYTPAQERGEMKPQPPSGVADMSVKVLSMALLAAIVALPVPASQLLAGTSSATAPRAIAAFDRNDLRTLLEDPFLIDRMSFAPAAGPFETDTSAAPRAL